MRASDDQEEDKPCRACSDFKSWAKKQWKSKKQIKDEQAKEPVEPVEPSACPLEKSELGQATWAFLHTMASYYPEKPTKEQCEKMTEFFNIFAKFYPCEPCSIDFQEDIKKFPPKTKSRQDLETWLCNRHNTVNTKLGKPLFDCCTVGERWRDGWKDGSCDPPPN